MKIFEKFPETSNCIICKTNENKQCVLIPIYGTQEDNIIQATPVHLDCLEILMYYPDKNIIGLVIDNE